MTFTHYLEQKRFTDATVKSYMLYIRIFTDWLNGEQLAASEFTYSELLAFIRCLFDQGKSKRSIHHLLGIVRHYCNYLIVEGQRDDNPAAGLYIKGIVRKLPGNLLPWADMEELYRAYSIQLNVHRASKVIVGLLIYQGLTTEEVTRLEAVHIHGKEGKIFIRGTKRSNERWLPLAAPQLIELQQYTQDSKLKTGPLLVTGRKKEISPTNINNRIQHVLGQLRQLNPRVINAAQFRSSVITHWLRGNNLRQVQYMAGHKYVSSTQRYQLTTLEDLKSELQHHHPMS